MRALFAILSVAFLVACGEPPAELAEGVLSESARVPEEGSPEALGILALLNDASTTFEILDDDAGLDKRAATNLIARRDGPDGRFNTRDDVPYATIAEVDAVAWVGDAAIGALLAYAADNGFIRSGDVALYGVVESVTFTVDQAAAVVALCNTASEAVLDDDVALDRRAAAGIVEGRPFATVEEIAEVPYVGSKALGALIEYVEAQDAPAQSLGQEAAAHLYTLTEAAEGVLWMCDFDAPMRPFAAPGLNAATLNESNGKQLLDLVAHFNMSDADVPLADRIVDERTIDDLMRFHITPQPWWQDEERARRDALLPIYTLFTDTLRDAKVLEIGEDGGGGQAYGFIDIFFVGSTADGDLVGVYTVCFST